MHPTAIFAAGFLILFVGGGARFAIGLTLKPMVTELGWARGELGIAVAAYLVISAFATYLAGRLADRTSPSLLLTTGVVVSGLGIGLMCLVGEPWHALMLYGVVFAVGNGLASLTPVGVMVTRAFPSRPGFINSAVISGTSVGQLIMIAALAALLVQIGWRSVFVWLGIAHLALIPFLLYALPRGAKGSGSVAQRTGMSVLRGGAHLAVLAAACGVRDLRPRRFLRGDPRRGLRAGSRRRHADGGQPAGPHGADGARRPDVDGDRQRSRRPRVDDGHRLCRACRRVRADRGRSVAAIHRRVRAGVRRHVPRHRAADGAVRARPLRHGASGRADGA